MKLFIILFIVGIIGVALCELTSDQKSIISCIREIIVELCPNEDELLKKLSLEDFVKVLSERFYYWDLNDFVKSRFIDDPKGLLLTKEMNDKCGEQKVLIDDLKLKGEKLVQGGEGYEFYLENGPKSTDFMRVILGLIELTGHVKEISEFFEHQFASAVLGQQLYDERYAEKYQLNIYEKGIILKERLRHDVDTIPLWGYDLRTELIEDYCNKISTSALETNTGLLDRLKQWIYDKVHTDHKGILEKYAQRGSKRLENAGFIKHLTTTNHALFVFEVCDTSSWVNFESLDDEAKQYDRFECILRTANEFFEEVENFLSTSVRPDFRSTFVKKGIFSIEGITREAIEGFLKIYDKRYFRTILDIWNGTQNDLKKETEMEKKRSKFIALHEYYKTSLKWTCMTKDRDDVSFQDWLERFSILYSPPTRIMSYLEEFENDKDAENAVENYEDAKDAFENYENPENLNFDELYQKISKAIEDVERKDLEQTKR